MLPLLRRWARNLPTLLLSFLLALAVWISAVTADNPNQQKPYPRPVPIQIVGQDPGLVIVSQSATQVNVTINAPANTWTDLIADPGLVTATVDLSGLKAGTYTLPVQVNIATRPAIKTSQFPDSITITLEKLETKTLPIVLETDGSPAIGYQAGEASLSASTATVTGPQPIVDRISTLVAHVDLTQAHQDINTVATVQALDANNLPLTGITINPDKINVRVPVTQLGGYRDVVVKVVVTGQVANGYRLTSISVSPPTVTVFSANPQLVNDLPGFVETTPIDISGAKDDLDLRTPLNLPQGVSVVGDQTVLVQIGIAAIESSITLSNMKVDVVGLDPSLAAKISPNTVVVIISGPLPLLDALTAADVHVYVDLTGKTPGTYQLEPQVDIASSELQVESILPTTLEVTITLAPAGTSTTH